MLRHSPLSAFLIRLLQLGPLATLLASCTPQSPELPRPGLTNTPTPRPGTTLPPPQIVTPIPNITRTATPTPPAGPANQASPTPPPALIYEYLGRTMLRTSGNGLNWSRPGRVAETGIWKTWLLPCPAAERIGQHPFVPYDYECLAGGPPGIYVADGLVYVIVAVGQSPAGMGCYVGRTGQPPGEFQRCANNPLFRGAAEYGPLDLTGRAANPYFDFRTISAAETIRLGEGPETRYYMLYEGLRGPGPGDNGDTQFGLGLARSLTNQIDGPWETYPGNPILVDLPGNVGLGHADLVVYNGQTILYTSPDGVFRSRLLLVTDS